MFRPSLVPLFLAAAMLSHRNVSGFTRSGLDVLG